MKPTLALALEDFVPVLLTFFALIWLSKMVFAMDKRSGYIAAIGSTLILLGGFLKATSKLSWAVTGDPIAWMESSLFILMAPGFALLAWAIWCGQRHIFRDIRTKYVYPIPISLVLILSGGTVYFNSNDQGRVWFFTLLTFVVLMSSLMLVLLSRHAWLYRLKGTALLFGLYLIITLVLNGLARTPSPSITIEWMKQLINTAATAIFALASWQLWQGTKNITNNRKVLSPNLGKPAR